MKSEYDRIHIVVKDSCPIQFWGDFSEAINVLNEFDENTTYTDINDIIELYNVYELFCSSNANQEYARLYGAKAHRLIATVARFFRAINNNSLLEQYSLVCQTYKGSFWSLFDKFTMYKNISASAFQALLTHDELAIYSVLQHKNIVNGYDTVLADFLREFENTAEILMQKYLEKSTSYSQKMYYIPTSLSPNEYEAIVACYIESENPHLGLLQLLASSQSSAEFPISDELRLKAKRVFMRLWNKRINSGTSIGIVFSSCFADIDKPVKPEKRKPFEYSFTYDSKWIRENLDYPTVLNNFIYLFNFTDFHFRCSFPSIKSSLSTLESVLGVKGIKEYEIGSAFRAIDMKSSVDMNGYMCFLSENGVHIEDVYKWFFTSYLKDEFGVAGFVFNGPTHNQTYLEKCRTLPSEMDGVLKQYDLFVKHHTIDRELLEISSKAIKFDKLPSMIANKYVYACNHLIEKEQYLLFSDQTLLGYFPEQSQKMGTFYEVLSVRDINISDYPQWQMENIRWLEKRSTIKIDSLGTIQMNKPRAKLLKDLYDHEVVCASYYDDKTEIEKLVSTGELQYGSSLFSIPEQHYLNYMLNKADYSNGLDLRNKYIHSTYPLSEEQQKNDYINLLKIMAFIIIKINEEFCLKYPLDD